MYTERQDQIIKYLADVKFAKIEQLAKEFDVSNETIRRDLFDLEREGVIKRIRGGAVFNTLLAHEMEFSKKLGNHQEEKQAIARTAVEYIDAFVPDALGNGNGGEAHFDQQGNVAVSEIVDADAFNACGF